MARGSTSKMPGTFKKPMNVGYQNLTPSLPIPGKMKGPATISTSEKMKGIPNVMKSRLRLGKKMTTNKVIKAPALNSKIKV